MKQEKVIELALKVDPDFQADKDDMYESLLGIDAVMAFARLVEQEALEKAAAIAQSWRGGKLLLNAGEMTGEEMRTVRAVTQAIGREIRAFKDAP